MKREKVFETMLVLALVALVVYVRVRWDWLIYIAIGFLALPLIALSMATIIAKGWFSFSHYLGIVMNYILMFVIFYFILTPLSFFQRLSDKNQFLKKTTGDSYFHTRNHLYSDKDIDRPW